MPDAAPLAASIAAILADTTLPLQEARILLGHALGLTRVQLITRSETRPDAEQAERAADLFQRRLAGEPIAYLIGEREFFGLRLKVTPAVLIPRPETELLVELALARLPPNGALLDLGTGSGAIPVAIAHTRPDAELSALDISSAALEVAQGNAATHQCKIRFLQSDWYAALDEERFDVITANPPYIVAGDRHLSQGDLRFEPLDALTDHGDGLSALRSIIAGAGACLRPGGWLLMEHGYDQAAAVRDLLRQAAMLQIQSWDDLAGIARATGARRSPDDISK